MVRRQDKLGDKSQHRGLKLSEFDIKNIANALAIYEKYHPRGEVRIYEDVDPVTNKPIEYIEYMNVSDHLNYMRKHIKVDRVKKGVDSPLKLKVSIPPALEQWLNKGYPTLFTDAGQTAQFLKAFPKFDLTK